MGKATFQERLTLLIQSHKRDEELVDLAIDETSRLEAEITELHQVLGDLVKKLDYMTPILNGALSLAYVHGARWPEDANWGKEFEAARQILNLEKEK